ncbi:hypothetical protein OC844_001553 [Tilletia horrida]|nr:hypothetical protein OC844_001553 [Tilletia horrida]
MAETAAKAKKKSFIPAAITNFARDAAVASVVEKGIEKGIREISKNKSLRRAGTDLIVNYARSRNASGDRDRGHHKYDDDDDDSDDDRRHRHASSSSKRRSYRDDYDDDYRPASRSNSRKGKDREVREMYNRGRRDPYEDPIGLGRSRSVSYAGGSGGISPYGDFRDRPPPMAPPAGAAQYYPSGPAAGGARPRKTSFGDAWLERAFGTAPTWQRGSGFRISDDRPGGGGGGGGLMRSVSNPGQPRSGNGNGSGSAGFSYSHGGHGYAFANAPPPSSSSKKRDGLPAEFTSPYDTDFRPRQAANREEEDYHRQLLARQAELGGVAISASGVPLYGYRPGEEPAPARQAGGDPARSPDALGSRNAFSRFFSPLSSSGSSPAGTPGGSGGGSRAPIETRMGTYNKSGSGLYSQTFIPAPSPPVHTTLAHEAAAGGPLAAAGAKELPDMPQTRQSIAPELRSKTRGRESEGETSRAASHSPERAHHHPSSSSALVHSPAIVSDPSHSSASSSFPIPHITKETSIQTLTYAARCSQIIYHLSSSSLVRHYQRNFDSHASNPSLLEVKFADPAKGTKNWALLRRKADGAIIVAVRGSGRGMAKGTDYTADLSWLDDEEWLSDMMLNLRARKWGGSGSGAGPAGGSGGAHTGLSRRNSTGSSGAQPSGSGHRRSSSAGLHLSSIRCADGSAFEAHEGFLRCAMAMYADVRHALDKKLKMWMVLAASSGIQIGLGGKGGPGNGDEAVSAAAAVAAVAHQELISPPELILTGHSAGGAVASLLYVLLNSASRELLDRFGKVSVITFGAAAAFPHPRSAPLTHANTHSSRRSLSGRVRDVHLTILHKDDPIPRMDTLYALSLLETAMGGPRNANAALLAISTLGSQSKNREVVQLVRLLKDGAERAKEMRRREKEARRIDRAAEEVVGGSLPGAGAGGSGEYEIPPKMRGSGMELWPAGDLFVLAPAPASSSSSSTTHQEGGAAEGMPKSILKGGSAVAASAGKAAPAAPPTIKPGEMQLYSFTHSQLAKSKPAEWSAHRIKTYFETLEKMEKRMPGLRI